MSNHYKESYVWGWDTETKEGPPISVQFFSEDYNASDLFMVNEDNITKVFIKYINKLPSLSSHVMFAHNLKFDLTSLFWPMRSELVTRNGFKFTIGAWEVSGVHGSPSFCKLWNPSRKCNVYLLDSFLWFQTSLDKAAALVCPHLPKLKMPEGLGTKDFKASDKVFVNYAMRDAEVSYHLGRVVQAFHEEFDLSQSLTLAHMASKIFRSHFLKHTLEQAPEEVMIASQRSYHGGKNNILPGEFPKWHTNVCSLDISSAYPFAMSQLPSFSFDHLYKYSRVQAKGNIYKKGVHQFGVYLISGETSPCKWPSLFDLSFKPIRGKFEDVWVASFDLNAAIKHEEVKLTSISGYFYDASRDKRDSPFAAYVSDFYERKQTASDPIQRYMYKTVLNSLYGKFIQTTQKEDETTGETYYEAGGMYQPFIASMITGHTRNYIHDLEHEFSAIHTATDGVFAKKTRGIIPKLRRFNKEHVVSGQLGTIELEGAGDLLLLRNKLYILYTAEGIPSKQFKGKFIGKYAMHGFQNSPLELERLFAQNRRKYTTTRPNQLRESLKSKQGKIANKFETREMVLKIGPIKGA